MAGKQASSGGDGFAEIDRLRQTFTRVILTSLALLYFALAGITTAMDRVNSDVVTDKLSALKDIPRELMQVSYVFSRQMAALPEPKAELPDRVEAEQTRKRIEGELETLAREWFAIRFQLLGTTISVDLRLIAPVVPFLVLVVIAYLTVTHRKVHLLESTLATASTDDDAAAVQPLTSPSFRRHPNVLFQFCILIAGATLLGWLIVTYASLQELISGYLQIDYANALICSVVYLILYVSYVTALLGGPAAQPGWYERARRGIRFVRRWFSTFHLKYPRGQLFSGSGLVLLTLVLGTATSCEQREHNQAQWVPRTGWEYLWSENDATWFTGDSILGSLTDLAMRPLYGALILASIVALIGALLPWGSRAWRWPRARQWTFAIGASLTGTTLLLAIVSCCLFGISTEMRDPGDYAALPVWLVMSLWLWRARQPQEYENRWELIAMILVPAAATFGVQATRYAASLALVGLPLLMIGSAMQCRVYRHFLGDGPRPPP